MADKKCLEELPRRRGTAHAHIVEWLIRKLEGDMKLYFALAALTAVYAAAITPATDPYAVLWNGVVGAMLSIALILSVIPAAGPLIYEVALRALSNSLHVDLGLVYTLLRTASWAINITFTAALALYLLQWQRARARRVIRLLLW